MRKDVKNDKTVQWTISRQVEAADPFLHGGLQLLRHNSFRAVLWQFQIIYARHYTRKVVVCWQRRLVGFAYDSERGVESAEAWVEVSYTKSNRGLGHNDIPPMGNLGLPVMNCKYSRRADPLNSDMSSTKSRIARLSTLKPWSAFIASLRAAGRPTHQPRPTSCLSLTLTFNAPVLLCVPKHHNKLLSWENLEVIDREDFWKALSEGLRLRSCPLANDSVNYGGYIFVDIICSNWDLSTTRLKMIQIRMMKMNDARLVGAPSIQCRSLEQWSQELSPLCSTERWMEGSRIASWHVGTNRVFVSMTTAKHKFSIP